MIREALEYLIDLGETTDPIVRVDDKSYSTKQLIPIKDTFPAAMELNFLDSMVTYIKENTDRLRPDYDLVTIASYRNRPAY